MTGRGRLVFSRRARGLGSRARAVADRVRVPRLVERLAAFLPRDQADRKVVILADRRDVVALGPWLQVFTGARLHVLFDRAVDPRRMPPPGIASAAVAKSAAQIDKFLRDIGTVDVIVDLRPASVKRYVRTWARCAHHLRRHGLYIARPSDGRQRAARAKLTAWAALNGEYEHVRVGRHDVALRDFDADALFDPTVTGASVLLGDALALVKRQDHLLLVTDDQVPVLLKREPELAVEIWDELPAGVLQIKATVTSHRSTRAIGGLHDALPYPRLQLRHYTGPIDFYGRTLLISGNSVLPDSYRFYRKRPPDHPLLHNSPSRAEFATGPDQLRPQERLTGTYYLLDPQSTGHFGHTMTEVVARLWGWDQAKARIPDLKVLTKVKPGRTSEPVVDRLLRAYGIASDDIVYVDHPVELESIVTASAMWHNFAPHFVHPQITAIWDRLGRALIDPSAPSWERIFVTRRAGSYRTCHNAPDVEEVFARHGFQIVSPEQYDLGIQAGFFRTARVVAGFGGSGMFNLMHSACLEQIIVLAHEAYTARNEHLYSAVLGGRADWFWSRPIRPNFQSDWNFDFDRNGPDLERLLDRE